MLMRAGVGLFVWASVWGYLTRKSQYCHILGCLHGLGWGGLGFRAPIHTKRYTLNRKLQTLPPTQTQTQKHTNTHTDTHTHTHAKRQKQRQTDRQTERRYIHTYRDAHRERERERVCVCVCVSMYAYIYIYIYVCTLNPRQWLQH